MVTGGSNTGSGLIGTKTKAISKGRYEVVFDKTVLLRNYRGIYQLGACTNHKRSTSAYCPARSRVLQLCTFQLKGVAAYISDKTIHPAELRNCHVCRMPKLYYFQAPTFSINPESDVAPKLGTIYPNLDRLTNPLNQFENVHVPQRLRNNSNSDGFDESVGKSFEGSAGLSANALQGLAGTAEVMYAFAHDKKKVYHCEELETDEFEPDDAFVNDSITASQRVQNFLENALPGRKRVYMITGLKVATGFSMSTSRKTNQGPILNIGVDGTAAGIPVEAGPELEFKVGDARIVSHGRTKNKIVFAYRVIKIKRKRDGQARYKHRSGGKYAEEDDSEEEEEPWELEPLEEVDVLKEYPESVPVEVERSNN
jgi:hypothetical protein